MIMKKNIIFILCCSVMMLQYSCKKTLSALPENAKVDANTILDQKTAEVALKGAYYLLYNIPFRGTNTTCWDTHQWQPAYYAGYLTGASENPEEENRYTEAYTTNAIWEESYLTINAANGIINRVEMLPDNKFTGNRKNGILGEARFLRAYSHFKLLSYYAEWFKRDSPHGILIRDVLANLSNISKAKSSVKDSYDFILADLDFAIAKAPADNPNYYAGKWAAMALKMRVLMSSGRQTDYTSVIGIANELIQNGPYQLEANPKDIFRSKGLSSKEVIMGIKPQPNQENDPYNLSIYYSYYTAQITVGHAATKQLRALFTADDPRGNWVTGAEVPNNDKPGSCFFSKYIAVNAKPTIVSETSYAFRLSEVYLLKAEAISRSNGSITEAKDILKKIMGQAGVTDFTTISNISTHEALQLELFYEITRSLVGEDGQEWMALLRLPFSTVKTLKPSITNQAQYILPIPTNEFLTNPAIGPQNPGYNK
ncbi:SusD family protein [Pedobacter africanus]|uniref:SusD family protein n=2 Tax=Pedobacter africanus TaxID=151894 RepID=A0A1W2DVV3_9SPHI|nr:SusD family protein [Pedobacter africanus]